MLEKERYANGQRTYIVSDGVLTYFYKNGRVRAQGPYRNDLMEGEWVFYRETGQLWQVGHFLHSQKDGSWVRYDRQGDVEYDERFVQGKILRG